MKKTYIEIASEWAKDADDDELLKEYEDYLKRVLVDEETDAACRKVIRSEIIRRMAR